MKEKKEDEKRFDYMPVQMAIDPLTGRDITSEVISRRLKELDVVANDIIASAVAEYKKEPDNKREIYEKYYWMIHEELGMGSIGPATAAAGPLMYEKMDKLADLLNIDKNERI